jgi:hypothetical protein
MLYLLLVINFISCFLLDLDLEYRYWAFMEAHPAHLPVSHKAKAEALDVLTWALTDQLLPSHCATPAPFIQEECQELRTILASFNRGKQLCFARKQAELISPQKAITATAASKSASFPRFCFESVRLNFIHGT